MRKGKILNPILNEQRDFLRVIGESGLYTEVRKLQIPRASKSLIAILSDWLVIILCVFAVTVVSSWLLPIGILIIGSRQRAFSNIVHDASHGNLFRNKHLNDLIVNLTAALPMFETVGFYRKSHVKHHKYLGNLSSDPDSIAHQHYGYNDDAPPNGTGSQIYLNLLRSPRAFFDSAIGNVMRLNSKEIFKVASWWLCVIAMIALTAGGKIALSFCVLWMVARATSYHAIRILAEFLDHAGLKPGTISGFTRNIVGAGFLRNIFHPHSDTFHLVHHFLPNVPHYHLREVHLQLTRAKIYGPVHNCTGYFGGGHSAIDCWMGKCQGDRK